MPYTNYSEWNELMTQTRNLLRRLGQYKGLIFVSLFCFALSAVQFALPLQLALDAVGNNVFSKNVQSHIIIADTDHELSTEETLLLTSSDHDAKIISPATELDHQDTKSIEHHYEVFTQEGMRTTSIKYDREFWAGSQVLLPSAPHKEQTVEVVMGETPFATDRPYLNFLYDPASATRASIDEILLNLGSYRNHVVVIDYNLSLIHI